MSGAEAFQTDLFDLFNAAPPPPANENAVALLAPASVPTSYLDAAPAVEAVAPEGMPRRIPSVAALAQILSGGPVKGLKNQQAVTRAVHQIMEVMPEVADLAPDRRVLTGALDLMVATSPRFGFKKRKTAQNVRSLVKQALDWVIRVRGGRPTRGTPLTPEWAAVWNMALNRWDQATLSFFMKWCSGEGILPAAVSDATMDRFRGYLEQAEPEKKRWARRRDTIRAWNANAVTVPGWPAGPLAKVKKERPGVAYSAYSESFRKDLERDARR